jgi:hypothetical protein
VTWFVHLPGSKGGDPPIATIVPKLHAFKDRFDVELKNVAKDGDETVLEVRGQDRFKIKIICLSQGHLGHDVQVERQGLGVCAWDDSYGSSKSARD